MVDVAPVVDTAPVVDMAPVVDTAPVVDMAPVCPSPCALNTERCEGNVPEVCTAVGSCPTWVQGAACPSPQVCNWTGGKATCGCPAGGCTLGAAMCGPNGGVTTCKMTGVCPAWSSETMCAPNKCEAGACLKNCHDSSECDKSGECTAANVCVSRCRAPAASNKFPNAGFDTAATGWLLVEQPAPMRAAGWDPFGDASGCATSGALKTVGAGITAVGPLLPATPGQLVHFGYVVKRSDKNPAINPCTINWCKTDACVALGTEVSGQDEAYSRPAKPGTEWEESSGDFVPPPGIVGVRVVCGFGGGTQVFDHFYWSTNSAEF